MSARAIMNNMVTHKGNNIESSHQPPVTTSPLIAISWKKNCDTAGFAFMS